MLKIQRHLTELLTNAAGNGIVTDVRIGLGYTAVKLDSGRAGVAWTPMTHASSCTHLKAAGTLAGTPVKEILPMLTEQMPLARAIGLATANALLATLPPKEAIYDSVVDALGITEKDHVAMVGYFSPILDSLKKAGCRLDIVELNPDHGEGTLTPEEGKAALAACTVAIITGTSLVNGTFDDVNAALGNPRTAMLLGPSSPLYIEAFRGTKITHIAGARVINADRVLQIISEGGGTMLLKKHMDFQTVTELQSDGTKKKKGPCTGEHCTIDMCNRCRVESTCAASKRDLPPIPHYSGGGHS